MATIRETANVAVLGALMVFSILASSAPANAAYLDNGTNLTVDAQLAAQAQVETQSNLADTAQQETQVNTQVSASSYQDMDVDSDDSINYQMSVLRNETSFHNSDDESSFTVVSTGNGWVTTDDESGRFTQISFIERVFVDGTDESEAKFGTGLIRVADNEVYRLRLHSQTDDSVTFDVLDEKGKTQGTLIMKEVTSVSAFTIWKGEMQIDSGSTYDLDMATMSRKTISADDIAGSDHANEGEKIGAWQKLRAFLRLN